MQTDEVKNFYNTVVKDKYNYHYEYNRWFKNPLLKSGYDMTHSTLVKVIKNLEFNNYIEVGPGPGTWTRLFLAEKPDANYHLVDISKEMIEIAKERLKKFININFSVSDFTHFESNKNFDLFFSSRAVEYMPDKKAVFHKIFNLLSSGGRGLIITKTPKYLRSRLLGRKIPAIHQNQISPQEVKYILVEIGFKNIKFIPVALNFPIIRSVFLSNILYKIFGNKRLNSLSQFFSESYMVTFQKP